MPTADRMKRRDFIALLLGGTTTAWPLAARGQSMPVIGFLAGGLANAATVPVAGFRQGLRQTGYVEGQNLHIAFRWAEGRYERFPELAAELVSLNVSAITAISAPRRACGSCVDTDDSDRLHQLGRSGEGRVG